MTNSSSDRLDQILEAIAQQQQLNARSIELLGQRVDSNAKAIEANSSGIAANITAIAATHASVDGLVQTITEFSIRSQARLNRLEDAVVAIERILERLTDQGNGNTDQQ